MKKPFQQNFKSIARYGLSHVADTEGRRYKSTLSVLSRLGYIGNSFEIKEAKNFAEDFIERLKFVGEASEEEIGKIASEMLKKR